VNLKGWNYLSGKSVVLMSKILKIEVMKNFLSNTLDEFVSNLRRIYEMGEEYKDFNEIINYDWRKNLNLIKTKSPEDFIFSYFHTSTLFLSIRGVLSEKELTLTTADISISEIRNYIYKGVGKLPEDIKLILKELKKYIQDEKKTEIFLIRKEVERELEFAERDEFLKRFLEIKVDLTNIVNFIRHKALKESDFYYIPHGTIKPSTFDSFEKSSLESFIDFSLRKYPSFQVERKMEDMLLSLGKIKDEYLIKYLKKAQGVGFGPSLPFAYMNLKLMEYKNLRTVYIGIKYNLPESMVIRRLRNING